ncbi:hypothetical protein EAG_06234 [Camponotus floridanus]|uniref:Uncharacterized protein n=1 Tax=Camponotus floridanus TaxID=104421 RepID=E2A620_CAMFO|nr:hypothetical protein EAG_06234 [Camponotus floridanus]
MIGAKDLGWMQRKNWQRRAAFLKSAEGELVARARRSTHRQKGARPSIRFLSSASPRTRLSCVRGGSHRETREEHEINQKSQTRSKRRRNGKGRREGNLVGREGARKQRAKDRETEKRFVMLAAFGKDRPEACHYSARSGVSLDRPSEVRGRRSSSRVQEDKNAVESDAAVSRESFAMQSVSVAAFVSFLLSWGGQYDSKRVKLSFVVDETKGCGYHCAWPRHSACESIMVAVKGSHSDTLRNYIVLETEAGDYQRDFGGVLP